MNTLNILGTGVKIYFLTLNFAAFNEHQNDWLAALHAVVAKQGCWLQD